MKPSREARRAVGLLQCVGDVEVLQRKGVAVLPQGRGDVAVTQALLGVKDAPLAHQDGRDGVS